MTIAELWTALTHPTLLSYGYNLLWLALLHLAVYRLLIQRREPAATLAWLLVVIVIPIFGPLLFFVIGPQRLERQASKRKTSLKVQGSSKPPTDTPASILPGDIDEHILRLAQQVSDYRLTPGNQIELLPDPAKTLESMHAAIEGARHFVHLEYYIIASDEVTEQLFASLEQALNRGVEVRILYDAFGSLFLKRRYFAKLIQKGAKVAGFLPLSLAPNRLNFNFRNHRKILIVDGALAFTGGTNIGRDYLGSKRNKQWRDFSVRVQGPVVSQLQDVFAKDWAFTTKEDLFSDKYCPATHAAAEEFVQVLESGPDSAFLALHNALFLGITTARHSVHLTTPYFVPDAPMMSALTVAALRGVDVKLLLPAKTDAPIVRAASRSFYETLLEAGVKIYEYQPTILHSKLILIDNQLTVVGSANMDIRSFRLNFELNLLVLGKTFASQAERLFQTDIESSVAIDPVAFKARPVLDRLVENACRLLSPIL